MFRPVLAFSLLTLSSLSVASEQATKAETLPLYYSNKGHAYVLADIDHQKQLPMILDTAATMGVLPIAMKDKLATSKDAIQTIEVQGAVSTRNLELLTANSTSVGSHNVPELGYVFQDMNSLQAKDGSALGILGYGFLSQHCIEFDFSESQLALSKTACSSNTVQGLREADFYLKDNLIRIKTKFNGKTVDAVLDTAAPNSYVNESLFKQLDVEVLEEDVARGLNDQTVVKNKLSSVSYQLGETLVTDKEVFLSNMPVFSVLGYKDKPFFLIGLDYFKSNRLVVDYHANKIYF